MKFFTYKEIGFILLKCNQICINDITNNKYDKFNIAECTQNSSRKVSSKQGLVLNINEVNAVSTDKTNSHYYFDIHVVLTVNVVYTQILNLPEYQSYFYTF